MSWIRTDGEVHNFCTNQNMNKDRTTIEANQCYGGWGGEPFDDGCHKRISKIHVRCGQIVDSIEIEYNDNDTITTTAHGGKGGEDYELMLREDEYVIQVMVRASKRVVQSLTFRTNLGRILGPCGSKGGVFSMGFGGKERQIDCPFEGFGLAGIRGRKGKFLDAIGFHWGLMK